MAGGGARPAAVRANDDGREGVVSRRRLEEQAQAARAQSASSLLRTPGRHARGCRWRGTMQHSSHG